MLYRILGDLGPFPDGTVMVVGTVDDLDVVSPKAIKALLANQRIAPVQSPPLSVLPGWGQKATAFAGYGVHTISDLLEVDLEELAGRMHVPKLTLERCVDEAKKWLT